MPVCAKRHLGSKNSFKNSGSVEARELEQKPHQLTSERRRGQRRTGKYYDPPCANSSGRTERQAAAPFARAPPAAPQRVRPEDEHALAGRRRQRISGVQRRGGSRPPLVDAPLLSPSLGPSASNASLRNLQNCGGKLPQILQLKLKQLMGPLHLSAATPLF